MTDEGGALGIASGLELGSAEEALLERATRGEPEAFDASSDHGSTACSEWRSRSRATIAMRATRSRRPASSRGGGPRLRDRSRFDAWLSQILVNACRGQLRNGAGSECERWTSTTGARRAACSTPGERERSGEVDAIRRAFDRLDPTTRALLAMHYVEERPLAEIGRVLRAPPADDQVAALQRPQSARPGAGGGAAMNSSDRETDPFASSRDPRVHAPPDLGDAIYRRRGRDAAAPAGVVGRGGSAAAPRRARWCCSLLLGLLVAALGVAAIVASGRRRCPTWDLPRRA